MSHSTIRRASHPSRSHGGVRDELQPAVDVARQLLAALGEDIEAGRDRAGEKRRERKKVEVRFAHTKRILKLDRLRLRGLTLLQSCSARRGRATIPIQTLLVAATFGREPLTAAKIAGVFLALSGIVVVFGAAAFGRDNSDYLIGDALMLLGVFCGVPGCGKAWRNTCPRSRG
jgi:hypothetical protein